MQVFEYGHVLPSTLFPHGGGHAHDRIERHTSSIQGCRLVGNRQTDSRHSHSRLERHRIQGLAVLLIGRTFEHRQLSFALCGRTDVKNKRPRVTNGPRRFALLSVLVERGEDGPDLRAALHLDAGLAGVVLLVSGVEAADLRHANPRRRVALPLAATLAGSPALATTARAPDVLAVLVLPKLGTAETRAFRVITRARDFELETGLNVITHDDARIADSTASDTTRDVFRIIAASPTRLISGNVCRPSPFTNRKTSVGTLPSGESMTAASTMSPACHRRVELGPGKRRFLKRQIKILRRMTLTELAQRVIPDWTLAARAEIGVVVHQEPTASSVAAPFSSAQRNSATGRCIEQATQNVAP
jgi:hypothetical protein